MIICSGEAGGVETMSNFLGIATVTAAFGQFLQDAIESAVAGADVSTVRPDVTTDGVPDVGVNLYLYQVVPNPTFRNVDLPTRRSDGSLSQRPQIALDLNYLLTFFGDESQLEPHRLLGSVISALHSTPMLTRDTITRVIDAAVAADPAHYLADSDLAEQVESIRFSPLSLTLEELSQLWSSFFQTAYTLSIAYQVSVVLLEADLSPQPAPPVRQRNLYVVPVRQPVIERVVSQVSTSAPITLDSTLVISGKQLRANVTQLRIGETVIPLDIGSVGDTRIILPLAADMGLQAGVLGAQVLHPNMMGESGSEPATEHRGFESNVAAFVLRPIITDTDLANITNEGDGRVGADVEISLNPEVGKDQRVVLLLTEFNPPSDRAARAYRFEAPPPDEDAPDSAESIVIRVSGVRAASYLVRVQVDGAESLLETDANPASPTFNQFHQPRITL